jgi:hypothetical protein
MAADTEEKLCRRAVMEIGKVRAVKFCVGWKSFWKVEAEGQLSLEPGLHRVPVGGDHLRWLIGGERCYVLIKNLAYQASLLQGSDLCVLGLTLRGYPASSDDQQHCSGGQR